MMHRKIFCMVLLAVLVSACGGGGGGDKPVGEAPPVVTEPLQPAAAMADGLVRVSVQNASGYIELQQQFSVDAVTGDERVTTTVAPGTDGVWGTDDDWRAAIVQCRYSAGSAVDQRLLQAEFFQPAALLTTNAQACLWRQPLAGGIQATLSGLNTAAAQEFAAVGSSPTGLILLSILYGSLESGDLMGVVAGAPGVQLSPQTLRFSFSAAGLLGCPSGCEEIPVPVSVPADAVCNVNCTGLDNIVYNPYAGLDTTGTAPPAGVHIYNGIRFFPVYAEHRLQRLVQSIALNKPLSFPLQYEEFRYSSGGELQAVDTFTAKGADSLWFTTDDVLSAYLTQQATADGWQRVYYTAAGVDGVWKTGDDQVSKVVILHRDTQARITSVQVCDGAGPDTVWQTADDICRSLIFHYADTDA